MILLGTVGLISAGCAEKQTPVISPMVIFPSSPSPLDDVLTTVQYRVGGRSVKNRLIEYEIQGYGPDCTLILATIHGNEDAGTPLVRYLSQYLQNHRELLRGRTVIIVPQANPDGRINRTRENARGVDLNRNFQAENRINNAENGRWALSEPEAFVIEKILKQYNPNKIVSLHQPLACVDYDGPAEALAQSMAELCPLPVKKLGTRPGSLGAYTGESLGIPTITFEMTPGDSNLSTEALWARYGDALLAAVIY
jgi:protein MpaA